ncbi:hypothetical protein CLOM_g3534, partial [Closterium sp. NIES-68]
LGWRRCWRGFSFWRCWFWGVSPGVIIVARPGGPGGGTGVGDGSRSGGVGVECPGGSRGAVGGPGVDVEEQQQQSPPVFALRLLGLPFPDRPPVPPPPVYGPVFPPPDSSPACFPPQVGLVVPP